MGRKRKKEDVPSEQVHTVIIMLLLRLVLGVGLYTIDVAALLGILPNTAGYHVRKKRAMQGLLPNEESEELANVVGRLKINLLQLHQDELRKKETLFEVMCFPEKKESETHIQRLEELIDATTSTIEMAMYAITRPRLVAALIRAQVRGVVVRVITYRTLMKCDGSLVLSLIEARIRV